MLRSIGKQPGESAQSAQKKKRKATVERICKKVLSLCVRIFARIMRLCLCRCQRILCKKKKSFPIRVTERWARS